MQQVYIKSSPNTITLTPRTLLPMVLIGIGVFLLVWVGWPILTFRLQYGHLYATTAKENNVVSPLPANETNGNHARGVSSGTASVDYTKASNWLPTAPARQVVPGEVNSYKISIPRLGIEKADVVIGSNDLNKSLIHYGGTGLPGEYGNSVVFGHSVLPQFYDPTDYHKIFSTLPSLQEGDEITVSYDGITYTYIVEAMRVTTPHDVSGLQQRYDDSYLNLVTCVPPGTYKERLWVTTRLKDV